MTPGKFDLKIVAGDTYRRKFKIQTASVNVDMTGWSWASQIRNDFYPEGELFGSAVTTVDLAEATVEVVFAPSVTKMLRRKGRYVWDLEATVGADIQTWLFGQVRVLGEVTHV